MRNVVVSAASLRMGGAVTVYNQFINHLREDAGDNRYFIFVNKVLPQPLIDGVKYYVIDIESKVRRNWFDNYGCKIILEQEGFLPDIIVSLQNTGVRCFRNMAQLVYYHQSLPFFEHRWNPFKKEERSKFVYKHFYLWFVKRSIGPKTQFAVQTNFVKENLVKRLGIDESRVTVCFPNVFIPRENQVQGFPFPPDEIALIYPSLYSPHKRYDVLIRALSILCKASPEQLKKVRVYCTFNKGDAPELEHLMKELGVDDKFVLMGKLPYEMTLSLYKTASALLFPSAMETLGLPLLEAAFFGLKVLVADLPYAHEVLDGYEGVTYVREGDEEEWSNAIAATIRFPVRYPKFKKSERGGWHLFFELINKFENETLA